MLLGFMLLWCRLAATALIQLLDWEHPYANGGALERQKNKQTNKRRRRRRRKEGVPVVAQWLTNPTRNHEVSGLIPSLTQWVKNLALP